LIRSAAHGAPRIYLIGGPNGAGKSSVAAVLLPESIALDQFVNADLIAEGLSPFAPESAAIAAGRIMIERMYTLRDRGVSFAFESTLASKSPARFLADAQQMGYVTHLVFLWLDSVQLAQSRVLGRVAAGGHNVPPSVINRRYWRGLRNLVRIYMPLVDGWSLIDSSGPELAIIAERSPGSEATIAQPDFFAKIRSQADHA